MKIKMLQTVEDSNATPVKDGRGKWSLESRIDRLNAGQEYDLADEQANNLISLGYAARVRGEKPAPAPEA